MWEQFIDDWESTRKNPDWICESCIYYPPSSCDGKPCCLCDPDDPMLNCYQEKEGADNDT